MMVEYFKDLEHYAKVKMAYDELATFVPGQGGLQYYNVDPKEHKKWEDEQQRISMEEYMKHEAIKKKELHKEFEEIQHNLQAEEKIRKKKGVQKKIHDF